MKQYKNKIISSLIIASMVLSLSACSFLDNSAEEIKTVADEYFTKLVKGKDVSKLVEASKKSKKDKDDEDEEKEAKDDSSLTAEQQLVLDAILENASYEILETEGSKKDEEGSATVEFTYVDASKIMEDLEEKKVENLVDEISSAKDKSKDTKEFEIEFVLDEDNWLVKSKSDKKVQDFLTGLVDEIEFSALNEASAKQIVIDFYTDMAEGKISDALKLTNIGKEPYELYSLDSESNDYVVDYDNICAAFFMSGNYKVEEVTIEGEVAKVMVKGQKPSSESILKGISGDKEALATVFGGLLYSQLKKQNDFSWVKPYLSVLNGYVVGAESEDYEIEFEVALIGEDELQIQSDISSIIPQFSEFSYTKAMNSLSQSEQMEVYEIALSQLLDQGKITQAEYDAAIESLKGQSAGGDNGNNNPEPTEAPSTGSGDETTIDQISFVPEKTNENSYVKYTNVYSVRFCTKDKYTEVSKYSTSDPQIMVELSTEEYHKAGDSYYIELYDVNGNLALSTTFVEEQDDVDDVYATFTPKEELKPGIYVFVFYDKGSKTSVACVCYAVVE